MDHAATIWLLFPPKKLRPCNTSLDPTWLSEKFRKLI
jgi:hypothetical protein